MMTKFNR